MYNELESEIAKGIPCEHKANEADMTMRAPPRWRQGSAWPPQAAPVLNIWISTCKRVTQVQSKDQQKSRKTDTANEQNETGTDMNFTNTPDDMTRENTASHSQQPRSQASSDVSKTAIPTSSGEQIPDSVEQTVREP